MKSFKRLLALMLVVCMLVGVLPTMSIAAADPPEAEADPLLGNFLEISQGNDLSTVGSNAFNVFMYDNTFSGTFGDQHMGGIELSLNGTRIATNGDLHLLPTPEQWDATPAPSKGQVTQDRATNTVTVPMTFNSGTAAGSLRYNLVASPTKDGLRLRMILTSAMPEGLQGKARFNLEFLPASYESKTYRADLNADGSFDRTGIFPLHPQDAMEEVERADLGQQWYVTQWNEDRGDAQPLPFATGYAFDFAPEDSNCNIKIVSNDKNQQLELYDGRNRAQNGWYVLSTEITATDAGDVAVDWLITPNVSDGWVRPANVGFSQVGYTPDQAEKYAVVELDKYGTIGKDYPEKIGLYRVNADGSEDLVKEATLSEANATAWMRYKHIRFSFDEVTEPGLYRIRYGDQACEVFPIENDAYDNIWQSALSGFLAVQMDHMELREGYKIWHGAAHMDDAGVAIGFSSYFDGMGTMGTLPASIQEKFPDAPANQSINHVDGLNKGGWFDAGDFDIQGGSQNSVMTSLIAAAEAYDNMDGYDTLTVTWDDETGGSAEMHRPDGIPDIVEQVIHGSKNMLAQYECLGGIGGTVEVRTLRQYTHLGDPSSDTDGYIYDPALAEDEIVERDGKVYSGKPDDRWLMLSGGGRFTSEVFGTYAKFFAGTAYLAGQYADVREDMKTYAAHIMGVANDVWVKEHSNAQPSMNEWDTLVQYALATKVLDDAGIAYSHNDTLNYKFYKARLDGLVDQALSEGVNSHINLLFIKDLMDDAYWSKVEASVNQVAASQTLNDSNAYGLRLSQGSGWGGSPQSYSGVRNISMMYNFFPKEEFEKNILRSVNYLLGRHPATNASWISGVGTKSALHPYNSNRGDESFIPGSILPGYITFSDYAESLDDFSFLWFEGESIITYQADWLPVGIAAGRIAHKNDAPEVVNKDALNAAIGKAEALKADDYTADSYAKVTDALAKAKAVAADEEATQSEVNKATAALNAAINALVPAGGDEPPTVSKDALKKAISDAESKKADDYTADSFKAMTDALTQAKAVDAKADATQTEVDDATTALNDAIKALVPAGDEPPAPADKTALNKAIADAEALKADDYTADSYKAVTDALAEAKTVAAKADATQAEVDAAAKALTDAVAALVPAGGDVKPTIDSFTDVEKDPEFWYHDGISYMLDKGYMNGTDATTFKPLANIKRGDLVQILYRIAGEPDVSKLSNPFQDIQKDYYKNAITWAADKGIVTGKTETKFAPEDPITREQLAAILYRQAGKPAVSDDNLTAFPDGDKVQTYAKDAMNWAVGKKLINGIEHKDTGVTTLSPQNNSSRAQIAVMLYRDQTGAEAPAAKTAASAAVMAATAVIANKLAPAKAAAPAETKDFDSSLDVKLVKKTISSFFGESQDGYLADDGFNVFMYSTGFDNTFGDQHCAGIELVQNGRRIATNGDIHLLPTPEQWDATPAPVVGERTFDEATNTITVPMTLPAETLEGGASNPEVKYQLISEPEEGGVKLTLKLDGELPADLVGKAGFNLEFLPAVFIGKSFQADTDSDGNYDSFGVFPLSPGDDMEEIGRARTSNQSWYVQQWNEDRGDYQPLPFAEGTKMTFAAEDDDYRIRISCDDGLALYDGRNRAQNGWFVLRTLIPEDATEIVWHISADTKENWTRKPNITHSQVGYEPEMDKVAVLELDMADAAKTEKVLIKKMKDDGTYETVKEVEPAAATTWQRYAYRNVDFSDVKEPGTYVIEYGGVTCDPFPIGRGVYANIWQQSLSNYMAVQMDHMRIREGYKIWRNPAHMDDALQAPTNMDWFDGAQTGQTIDTKYKPYEHIPGLDVGGFSDAGDFDIQTLQNIGVVNSLALAYETYENDYDTLDINWDAHNVELHRPDGMADLQQLAKHGALNLMAQQENIGFLASVIEVPTLRQYTHLGDGSKDTDGKIYDPALDEGEINGLKAGLRDDRLAFAFQKNTSMQVGAAAALASTGYILREVDPETSEKAIKMAEEMWTAEGSGAGGGGGGWFQPDYWGAAISLYKATGKDEYKNYITSHWDEQMATEGAGWFGPAFASGGWEAVRVLDQLGDEYKTKFETVLKSYAPNFDTPTANNPFGVADTFGMWGGSGTVVSGATTQAVLHHYYPDVVGTDAVFRAINYILGTHPYNSTSWISGVGNTSVEKGYGSNRAERYYIAGGLAPGYVTIAPDFPEHMDDFNFLWFENEYTVEVTANWILLSMGADDYADENYPECEHKSTTDIVKEATCTTAGYTHHICNDCFETWDDSEQEALGHNYDNGQVTREPTASFDGVKTFTCQRCGATYTERIPATGTADMSDIDFTDPAAAEGRFIVEEPDVTEAKEGQGLYLISTREAFEDCNGQNSTFTVKDAVKIPVSGDWTATIKVDFDANGSNGYYDFFGFYAMSDDDNGAGMRGGNGAMQSWLRQDGGAIMDDDGGGSTAVKNGQGLTSSDVHYLRIKKTGTTYECYWSIDGDTDEDFGEPAFVYEDTGIQASYLFLDAYTGMTAGYTYYVEYCHFTDVSGVAAATVVDFTKDEAAGGYEIVGKSEGTAADENGLKLVSTTDCPEPAKNGRAINPKDLIKVPATGDWTAMLEFDFAANGSSGGYEFFGFYAMQGDDYKNLVGIRGGDGAMQDFLYKDGTVVREEQTTSEPGFKGGDKTYYYQIVKKGTTYTCYRSEDGAEFVEMFKFEDTGIESDYIIIDAYSGMATGYTYTLKKLVIEGTGGGAEPAAKPEVASIKVNGTALAGFDAKVKTYNVKVAKADAAPTVTADPGNDDTTIEIDKSGMSEDGKTGTMKVVATAGKSKQTYSIAFNYAPESDYFADGAMNEGQWTILNEQKDPTEAKPDCYYRFDQGVGLVMKTQHNSIYRNTSKEWTNVFTMPAQGDWEVVAKAYYKEKPKNIYQQVQLLGWQDEDNYVRINCQYPTAQSERGQLRIEPAYEKNAHFDNDTILKVSFVEDTNDTFYFKMKKDGTTYTVSYSTDCKTWIDGGTAEDLNYLDPKVGLFITQDHSNNDQVELAWEYIAVTSIDGQQQMTDAQVLEWAAQQAADYIAAAIPASVTGGKVNVAAAPNGYTVSLSASDGVTITNDGTITANGKNATTITVTVSDGTISKTATRSVTLA